MNKSIISLAFLTIFVSLTLVPTIVMLVDDTIDISFVYDITEEEEKKGKEKEGKKNHLFSHFSDFGSSNTSGNKLLEHGYNFKSYATPQLNMISPPPELHII